MKYEWTAAILYANFKFELASLLKSRVGWRKITES